MSNKKKIATLGLLCCLSVPAMAQSGNVLQSGTASSDASANNQTSVTAGSRSSAYGNISNQRVNATGGRSSSTSSATGGNATGGRSSSTSRATGGTGTGGSATTGSSSATAGNVTINNLYGSDPSGSTGSGNLPASGQNATGAGTTAATGTGTTTDPAAANTFTDNVHYSGSQTIRNTPDVGAPALYGGTNPCSVGASAGLGLPGFGISGGATWSDRGCERRNGAVILFQANMPDVAVALLCQDSDMRSAFGVVGKPCPQDHAKQAAAAAPAPVQQVAARPAPAATVASASSAQTGYRGPTPAWCSTPIKDATDRAYHTYYCR